MIEIPPSLTLCWYLYVKGISNYKWRLKLKQKRKLEALLEVDVEMLFLLIFPEIVFTILNNVNAKSIACRSNTFGCLKLFTVNNSGVYNTWRSL